MEKFRDKLKREWEVDIDAGMIDVINARLKIDLLDSDSVMKMVYGGRGELVSVMWNICEDQIEKLKLDPVGFAKGFNGPTIEAAIKALLDELINFSHSPKTAEKMKTYLRAGMVDTEEKMAEAVGNLLQVKFENSFGKLPGSLELIRDGLSSAS
jgi:hypothetical protein